MSLCAHHEDGKRCDQEALPDNMYCEKHKPKPDPPKGGGGGGGGGHWFHNVPCAPVD